MVATVGELRAAIANLDDAVPVMQAGIAGVGLVGWTVAAFDNGEPVILLAMAAVETPGRATERAVRGGTDG